jgi:hypothetical protein
MNLKLVVLQNNFRILRNIIMNKVRYKKRYQILIKFSFNRILAKLDIVLRFCQIKEICKCKKKNKIIIKMRESLM